MSNKLEAATGGITSHTFVHDDGETYTYHSFTDADRINHTAIYDSGSIFLEATSLHGDTWKYHIFAPDAHKIIDLIKKATETSTESSTVS